MTQAELGQSALKVGETVLGGMKLLGGMAYDAAKNRVSGGSGDVGRVSLGGEGVLSILLVHYGGRSRNNEA